MYKLSGVLLFCLYSFVSIAQLPSKFIHVDQFGYLPSDSKVAVLSDPQTGYNSGDSYSPPAQLELRDAATDGVIQTITPSAWNGGATHANSGDNGWWADFSSFTTIGEYYIFDAANSERSATFKIGYDVYNDVLKSAGRMFYYNRCNATKAAPFAEPNWTDGMNFMNPLQDANCRYVLDQTNVALEKDLSGGWFDAGDYNKYITFAEGVMHDLLWAYEQHPDAFTDAWNIPESGNGIPDILDEIKWELDWMLKMTNSDGSVHIKMGSIDFSDNAAAPPSANTDARYYGPTCTSASIAIASVFSHAASVFETIPAFTAFAAQLEARAIDCWDYALPFANSNTLETNCDDQTIKAGDADRDAATQLESMVAAAAYLFDITGNVAYNNYFTANYATTGPITGSNWDPYNRIVGDALLHYTTISGNDAGVSTAITNSFSTAATNNWNGYYGFNDADLYRAFIPNWSYHWGSNNPIAGYAIINDNLRNYGLNPGSEADYKQKTHEQIHYFHGVNPLGIVYLSNMYGLGAEHSVNEIYHTWFNDGTDWDHALNSLYGPAPGFVSGGANADFTVATISPPFGQPRQKSYLDFNDGFPNNSWEISEPAIYYQASYIRMLAAVQEDALVLPVTITSFNGEKQGDAVQLSWTVEEEENVASYQVQRSLENGSWAEIGNVVATGASGYAFTDQAPNLGVNLYRLKAVDNDNTFDYSTIVQVSFRLGKSKVSIYPNPASSVLTITSDEEIKNVSIYSVSGSLISTVQFNNTSINISNLTSGNYLLKIETENGVEYQKLVVRK